MNRYEPSTPRAPLGLAAVCLTVATLALSVGAPAALNPEDREVAMKLNETQSAYANAGPLTTSIDVVAYRTTRLVPVVQSRVQLRNGASS